MSAVLLVAATFVLMEGVTYLVHRFVMHGVGWVLHRTHHRPPGRARGQARLARLEANDAFPVIFAGVTLLIFAAGTTLPALRPLVLVSIGISLYGLVYAFVHDVYIHGRLGRMPKVAVLERLKQAHLVHHLFKGEPFGMLFPYVPAELRERAGRVRGNRQRSPDGSSVAVS